MDATREDASEILRSLFDSKRDEIRRVLGVEQDCVEGMKAVSLECDCEYVERSGRVCSAVHSSGGFLLEPEFDADVERCVGEILALQRNFMEMEPDLKFAGLIVLVVRVNTVYFA